jgi:hypothetical protein
MSVTTKRRPRRPLTRWERVKLYLALWAIRAIKPFNP